MTNTHFKPVVNFETREDLENAWQKGQLKHDSLFRVLDNDVFYRLEPSGQGFIEMADPNDPVNSTLLIWWQDHVHVRWNNMVREKAASGEVNIPVFPGSVGMAIDRIGPETKFNGQFIIPLTLRHSFDPDIVNDVDDNQSLKDILMSKYIGIPFEICHYDKIKHYAGIITTLDLRTPDLCEMRELLAVGE
ncbi:hypothetical protein D3C85_15010 [compost metagenome]